MCPLVKLPEKYEIFKSWFIIIFMILASFIFLGVELSGTEENLDEDDLTVYQGSFYSLKNNEDILSINKFNMKLPTDSGHYVLDVKGVNVDDDYKYYILDNSYTENKIIRVDVYNNKEVCLCLQYEDAAKGDCLDVFVPVETRTDYTYLTECKK